MFQYSRPNLLMGWVTLRLNFRPNGYVSRHYLWTVRWENGLFTTLPLKFPHRRKLYSRLYSIEIYSKTNNKNTVFEPPFEWFRGNVCTPSNLIASWKACGRLPNRRNWTLFSLSLTVERSRNLSKSAHFGGGWSLWAQISDGRLHRPPTTVDAIKLEW